MTTDDMKPKMGGILLAMFNDKEGIMGLPQLEKLLGVPRQEVLYYAEKLEEKELIREISEEGVYELTTKGRAHVMENLKTS